MAYVYLMKARDSGGVWKIGETINLKKRLARKQKSVDFIIEYQTWVEVPDDMRWSVEHELHNMFSRYRLGADWFALPYEAVRDFHEIVHRVLAEVKARHG